MNKTKDTLLAIRNDCDRFLADDMDISTEDLLAAFSEACTDALNDRAVDRMEADLAADPTALPSPLACLDALALAAGQVMTQWVAGDLAGAVRELEAVRVEATRVLREAGEIGDAPDCPHCGRSTTSKLAETEEWKFACICGYHFNRDECGTLLPTPKPKGDTLPLVEPDHLDRRHLPLEHSDSPVGRLAADLGCAVGEAYLALVAAGLMEGGRLA